VHALLTGAAMGTMDLLGSRMGFGFSAGVFDYVLNYNRSTHALYLFPVGLVYALLYYRLFRYCILRFNLATPGRERDEAASAAPSPQAGGARDFVAALGGRANLREVDACTTRLRLELADRGRIDAAALRRLGARGIVNLGEHGVQVVLGPEADLVASA